MAQVGREPFPFLNSDIVVAFAVVSYIIVAFIVILVAVFVVTRVILVKIVANEVGGGGDIEV